MESTIYVDIGNFSVKIGLLKQGKWDVRTYGDLDDVARAISKHADGVRSILLCSVRQGIKNELQKILEPIPIKQITIGDIAPENLDYETPQTLGIDRYLGCLGAHGLAENGVVVIDAGSACTIDYMDGDGVYRGGVIMPGLHSIMNIFRNTAPALPIVEVDIPKHFPGKTTTECLQWGQVGFFVDGLRSMVRAYEARFGEVNLYFTGGDAVFLHQLMARGGTVSPALVLMGLKTLANE